MGWAFQAESTVSEMRTCRAGDQWKAEFAWTSGESTLTVMLAWAVPGWVRRTSLGGSPG